VVAACHLGQIVGMSGRTKAANAALTGLGNTRRIILGDTLITEIDAGAGLRSFDQKLVKQYVNACHSAVPGPHDQPGATRGIGGIIHLHEWSPI
jgi:hypothetical protein